MRRNTILSKLGLVFLCVITLASCQKFTDPAMVFEEEPNLGSIKARKVLVISIDGLSGTELQKEVPQNIQKLLEHSKYTFAGMADAQTGDASTWATILSGKSSTKHGVHGNSFEEDLDEDDPHGQNSSGSSTGFITYFLRLLEQGKNLNSFSATSVAELDENVMSYANTRILKSNDDDVKTAAIDTLKAKNLSFGVINFRSVNDAGVQGGFNLSNPDYKAAINKVDGYIGEILAALESRANFDKEDWMIVVTANHGGLGTTYGGASFEERKVPIILYNEHFMKQEFETPDLVNTLTVATKGAVNTPTILAKNSKIYDIGSTGEFTIIFKVFNNSLPGGDSHAVILGRTTHAYNATQTRGWHFMVQGSNAQNKYRVITGDGSSSLTFSVSGPSANQGQWETIAFKVYNENGKRYGQIFVNGVSSSPTDITGRNATADAATFFIGSGNVSSIGTFNGSVNNLVFVNQALSDNEIKNFSCLQTIDDTLPYWSKVTGYWPMTEGSGRVFKNKKETALNTDFNFANSVFPWNVVSSWTCLVGKELEEYMEKKQIINQYDILPQIAYWMGVKTEDSWALDGKVFLDRYEQEFIGK